MPVKKSGGNDYYPIQDLCAISSAVIAIHPVVPNPYTLLGLLPAQASWFTCLDLKDTFFCLQLSPNSQPLFAVEWEDPHIGRKTQLTWTRLPPGFKSSPILFGEALAVDLAAFPGEPLDCTLRQYMDVLLLASPTQGDCWRGTKALSALLSTTGSLGSADGRSSTWGLSSQNGIRRFDMRGSKPSVQYLGRTPTKTSVSSSGLPHSARSGYGVSLKLPSLCLKPQQDLERNP